jgi:hypothetical protein
MFKLITVLIIFNVNITLYSQELKKLSKDRYIVMGDRLNIREKPSIRSKSLGKLDITTVVKVIKKNTVKEVIGKNKGCWFYVNTGYYIKGTREKLKGWVFSYFLSDGTDFKKISKFKNYRIEGWVGDWLLSYELYVDGKFIQKEYDYDKDSYNYTKGFIYRYRNVIVLHDKQRINQVLYISSNKKLCSKHYDADGNQICSK